MSIANGVAYFESLGFFGVLSDIINPKKVPVRLSYQESSFQVSGTTLGNHMLAGERRWGVKLTKAKEGEWLTDGLVQAKTVITVWTESYDRPNGALNRGGMTMLGADSQLEVWEGYMRNMELAFMMRYKVKGWRGLIGDKHGLDDDNIRGSQQDLGDQPNPWQPRP